MTPSTRTSYTSKKLIRTVVLLLSISHALGELVKFQGVGFRVARAEPASVTSCYKNGDGKILHSLSAGVRFFSKSGNKVEVIMNGGIFEPGCVPSGLYIENGVIQSPLNLRTGQGNFFLKPNGVFLIDQKKKATIVKSEDTPLSNVRLAVQSGPLLLHKGEIHLSFRKESKSTLVRNGIGVDRDGKVIFAITDKKQLCNLWTFASLFKHLGCEDALFLDGDLSKMVENPDTEIKGQGFATMLAIVSEKK